MQMGMLQHPAGCQLVVHSSIREHPKALSRMGCCIGDITDGYLYPQLF